MTQRAYRYRFYPTSEQEQLLEKLGRNKPIVRKGQEAFWELVGTFAALH